VQGCDVKLVFLVAIVTLFQGQELLEKQIKMSASKLRYMFVLHQQIKYRIR
jgi:hypothetical protein